MAFASLDTGQVENDLVDSLDDRRICGRIVSLHHSRYGFPPKAFCRRICCYCITKSALSFENESLCEFYMRRPILAEARVGTSPPIVRAFLRNFKRSQAAVQIIFCPWKITHLN